MNKYKKLFSEFKKFIPLDRIYNDDLRTFAYGTDASFYRLTPKIVVKVISEDEATFIIKKCNEFSIPITFRASGTSLSGQSISNSVLLVADRSWDQIQISSDNRKVTVHPATLGGKVNLTLNRFNKKIGPDPASINAATVTGIASNNASGMTSGVANNSYNTLADMRVIFADGTVLNTYDEKDRTKFIENNRELVVELLSIASVIEKEPSILQKVVDKYKMKNTTGYSVNSFVDFQDPIEIIKHLMIGSEGTLGFISQLTLNTVPSLPYKASSLIIFPDVKTACSTIPILKNLPVDAAEIMDRASLKSVEDKKGLPDYLKDLNNDVAALLIETSANNEKILTVNIDRIKSSLESIDTLFPIEFTDEPKEYIKLWNVRKGLFPSLSKSRPAGTTVVIEDVNFDTDVLADAVGDLQALFAKHDYEDCIIWGHALSGNIHYVFAQNFNDKYEVRRYKKLMDDVVLLVIEKYNGSLKAEHGTGRNMAPFVKYEWGKEIYDIMVRTKNVFDPKGILNPGVLINSDEEIYIKNLKPTPIVNSIIDKCIDCGFCENICPSKNLTLTPRQRISVWREIKQLESEERNSRKYKKLIHNYKYDGEETCATDGLCELSCPVDIDTGKLIKNIRHENRSFISNFLARQINGNFSLTTRLVKLFLSILNIKRKLLGQSLFESILQFLRKLSFNSFPLLNNYVPKANTDIFHNDEINNDFNEVVYFPSCISRTMGTYSESIYSDTQTTIMKRLLNKANYRIIYPNNLNNLCCGMPFSSKGFPEEAKHKSEELYEAFVSATNDGQFPIVFDTSPCVKTFQKFLRNKKDSKLRVYDSVEFVTDYVLDRIHVEKKDKKIAIHPTCSITKMDLIENLIDIANLCATDVFVPEDINCCGFAGDRGFTNPELNKSALESLGSAVKSNNCTNGYSTSRTCEIGLSTQSGIEYNSILYLLDECSESKS